MAWMINRVLASSNRALDIRQLQQQHGAYGEKVTRLEVTDLKRAWAFRVREGKLELVPESEEAVGGFRTRSDVLIGIALGKRQMRHPGTGEVFEVGYTPLDALRYGDLEVWGDAASNDALLFARAVYRDCYPALRRDLSEAVQGPEAA